MSISLVIFDLDGVLIDAKDIHFRSLNIALPEVYRISYDEHLDRFDGLKTRDKLQMLTKIKGLPEELHDQIFQKKQDITLDMLPEMPLFENLGHAFSALKKEGIAIAVCSNSVRRTVYSALEILGLLKYCDLVLSNEDVSNSKPHPELFWSAMSRLGKLPEETLIVEDSPPGIKAAQRSGCACLRVIHPSEVDYQLIKKYMEVRPKMSTWTDRKMNVLIPMAGAGSRFRDAGYTFPKPLIEVDGKPMIQVVTENIGLNANHIFVVQSEHRNQYQLDSLFSLIKPGSKIVETSGVTEGAACTALLAKHLIDNDAPLFFANSDQFVEWDPVEFFYFMQEKRVDGGIVTFKATHPKWSFAKIDDSGRVLEVAEKKPISDNATVGFYFWKKGSDFVKYAEQMIKKNVRVNNEFYVCPVFNEAIADGKDVRVFEINKMWGLGTPEDLDRFNKEYLSRN